MGSGHLLYVQSSAPRKAQGNRIQKVPEIGFRVVNAPLCLFISLPIRVMGRINTGGGDNQSQRTVSSDGDTFMHSQSFNKHWSLPSNSRTIGSELNLCMCGAAHMLTSVRSSSFFTTSVELKSTQSSGSGSVPQTCFLVPGTLGDCSDDDTSHWDVPGSSFLS